MDPQTIKDDFPILRRRVRDDRELVYLDSAATSQKPLQVLDAERDFYLCHNAAAHRGAHQLAEEATEVYESARQTVADFLGAQAPEIVFTRNATEAINLVAYALSNASATQKGSPFCIGPGDEILITEMEHHANLVPWQQLAERTGATLRWVPLTSDGRLDDAAFDRMLSMRTKLVAVTHQSNVLGTINPVASLASRAHGVGALVLVDGAQSVAHQAVNIAELGADFFVFSAHKMLGPNGIGVLWGRQELLAEMPPFITGGSMIETVRMDRTTFLAPPQRFEAGVPLAPQAAGLAAAIHYLSALGMKAVEAHEAELTALTLEGLAGLKGVSVIGPSTLHDRGATVSFTVDGIHPHDVGQVLDDHGVAVRTGHHCARPICDRYGIPASTRASFYIYNTPEDIAALVEGIEAAQRFFA
ncbi:SufS family cysteine desulfurase [Streptomyces sp. NPDC050315]|uniref:SufS family cysteine desulfurase n=1 Tax=Streptomyces sp. NPDC050315 TaxID=3155039 RepID=UPI003415F904